MNTSVRFLILLAAFLIAGCSKKTLSGVYIHKDNVSSDSYDFRTDGLVLNDYKLASRFINDTINASGNYVIRGDKVTVDVIGTSELSGTITNHVLFRMDGSDLIHISLIQVTQNGAFTNIDKNQDRYIKQTQ